MEIYRSLGVSTLVALMAMHRAGSQRAWHRDRDPGADLTCIEENRFDQSEDDAEQRFGLAD